MKYVLRLFRQYREKERRYIRSQLKSSFIDSILNINLNVSYDNASVLKRYFRKKNHMAFKKNDIYSKKNTFLKKNHHFKHKSYKPHYDQKINRINSFYYKKKALYNQKFYKFHHISKKKFHEFIKHSNLELPFLNNSSSLKHLYRLYKKVNQVKNYNSYISYSVSDFYKPYLKFFRPYHRLKNKRFFSFQKYLGHYSSYRQYQPFHDDNSVKEKKNFNNKDVLLKHLNSNYN